MCRDALVQEIIISYPLCNHYELLKLCQCFYMSNWSMSVGQAPWKTYSDILKSTWTPLREIQSSCCSKIIQLLFDEMFFSLSLANLRESLTCFATWLLSFFFIQYFSYFICAWRTATLTFTLGEKLIYFIYHLQLFLNRFNF